ncbi:methyl-accepting chemotaxis protein, partial [Noviherbaspirillum galbum]
MRMNMPVTNVERVVKEGEYIVSKTDLKGRIVYCNRPFIEISGFSEEELIGTSHNIVRHPDMPPEAFADLWATLKSGKPWRGMVKNRCKNGDYYWVQANANPIWENGRITGYMSLRVQPNRQQVEAAEQVYRRFREGNARGLKIREGQVVRSGPLGWLASLTRMRIATRISLVMGALVAMLAATLACLLMPGIDTQILHEYLEEGATVGLVMLVFAWYMVYYRLIVPLGEMTRACQVISAGGLEMNADTSNSNDEIGALRLGLNTMIGNLASIVTDIGTAATAVHGGAHEIRSAANLLSQTASEQAAGAEETSA